VKLFSIYPAHNESFPNQQEKLVAVIISITTPDMIYLLGGTLLCRHSESIFCDKTPALQHVSDYFLLVLLNNLEGKEQYEWQDKIEQRCSECVSVTVIVMQTSIFDGWLQAGHRFARTVVHSAIPLYKAEGVSFSPAPEADTIAEQKSIAKYYRDGLAKGREFLAGAELFRIRNQYRLSAFMLHQATEHCLHGLIKAGTGFHAYTHNLDRLIRYGSLVCYQLQDIFSRKTEEDKRLFSLLQKAYGDARYKEDYSIDLKSLLLLIDNVSYLLDLTMVISSHILQPPQL